MRNLYMRHPGLFFALFGGSHTMRIPTSTFRSISTITLLILGWVLSCSTAYGVTLNAPLNQTLTVEFTPELLGYPSDPTTFDLRVSDMGGETCSEVVALRGEDTAERALCETETSSFNPETNILTYTPSQFAEAGDTYQLGYTLEIGYGEDEPSFDGGDVIITITGDNTAVKTAIGVFEDSICEDGSEDDFCDEYSDPSGEYTAEEYADSINPDEVVAEYTVTKQLISAQTGNVFGRISELRSGDTGTSVAGLTYTLDGEQLSGHWLHAIADSIGGGASADETVAPSQWGFFINGSISQGEKDGTDLERGYDTNASTVTLGADYRFSPTLIAGIAYGISQSSLDFDGSNDDGMDNDMSNVIVYGTWYKQSFNVDLLLGASQGDIDTSREILLTDSTAKGETDTHQVFFSIASGYDFSEGALSYGPYASFDYITGEIEAYDETGGGGLAVGFDDQDINSQVLTLGGRVSYAFSTEWGVIAPHARGEWKKEFDRSRDIISGNFVEYANSSFEIEADDFDDSWFHAGVGVSATFRYGLSAYIDYDSIIAYDETALNTVSYGGRWEAAF